jgi:hypothetical protein
MRFLWRDTDADSDTDADTDTDTDADTVVKGRSGGFAIKAGDVTTGPLETSRCGVWAMI